MAGWYTRTLDATEISLRPVAVVLAHFTVGSDMLDQLISAAHISFRSSKLAQCFETILSMSRSDS